MVQLSMTMAVAFMAATASALPSSLQPTAISKRVDGLWFAVYNYDPSKSSKNARTEQLFIEPGKCTTLENMWDKETRFVEVGPKLSCTFMLSEDCTYTNSSDSILFSSSMTTSSGVQPITVPSMEQNVNSYMCNELSTVQTPIPSGVPLGKRLDG